LLYERLPLALQGFLLPPGMWPRLIGSVAALALAFAALEFARDLARRGAALVAVACLVAFGGELVVFTGLRQPAALLWALTMAAALGSVRVATTGRGAAMLGCTVFAALVLHRAGLLLLACWLLALGVWRGRGQGAERPATLTTWTLALLPLLALAVVGP